MIDKNTFVFDKDLEKLVSRHVIDLFIRIGLIGYIVVRCYQVFKPFFSVMLLSIILAVSLYPLHVRLVRRTGGREGRVAAALVLVILVAILTPTALLMFSFAESTTQLIQQLQSGALQVPVPSESVAAWPLVGEKFYALWSAAHTDLREVLAENGPKIANLAKEFISVAVSATSFILMFLAAMIVAGIWMAYATSAYAAAKAIARRMVGSEKGENLIDLSKATIRAVAQGVIGIACIQALLLGVGFISIGIPGAGIWAMLVLLLGIMQIPAALVSLPTIIYVFLTNDSMPLAVLYAIYAVVAGSVDNVLKPLLLGRGVDAPMPVVLLGALGGMASGGVIGLFQGSVILTLGYQLFMAWVYAKNNEEG